MKKVLLAVFTLLLVLIAILLFNTMRFENKQIEVEAAPRIPIDDDAVQRLSNAIKIPTISYTDTALWDYVMFDSLHRFMAYSYPLVDSLLTKEVINRHSLLYHWKGKNSALKPAMFIAHTDVVPVENSAAWDHPPFSGKITEEFIYGRGTLDDKISVFGILEATEMLLSQGFRPEYDIYFGFGGDEEIGGLEGARATCNLLKKRGTELSFILDEGLVIVQDMVPGVSSPVALIGTAEKGYITLRLTASKDGGHSSMPQRETSVGLVCQAVDRLQSNPFPQKLDGASLDMFEYVAPEMPFLERMVFANLWLTKPLVLGQLANKPSTDASTRTTTAPTMLSGSIKENVLPAEASATVNFRMLPGETAESVLKRVKEVVNNKHIAVEVQGEVLNPPPVSDPSSAAFTAIHKTVKQIFPESVVAPALTLATTDSKHYIDITENTYRFLPITLTSNDLSRIHGSNERVSKEGYKNSIRFYYQLMRNMGE